MKIKLLLPTLLTTTEHVVSIIHSVNHKVHVMPSTSVIMSQIVNTVHCGKSWSRSQVAWTLLSL
jgi:hypothetical protein